jgi:hypothetical protein
MELVSGNQSYYVTISISGPPWKVCVSIPMLIFYTVIESNMNRYCSAFKVTGYGLEGLCSSPHKGCTIYSQMTMDRSVLLSFQYDVSFITNEALGTVSHLYKRYICRKISLDRIGVG